MCNHENREAAMVVLDPGTPERKHRDGIWCDPCIAPLVKALNDAGLRTIASCCGHGTHPSSVILADGRRVVLQGDPGWVVDPHMVSADVRVVEAAADHVEGNLH